MPVKSCVFLTVLEGLKKIYGQIVLRKGMFLELRLPVEKLGAVGGVPCKQLDAELYCI